jgi:hypothetical protein
MCSSHSRQCAEEMHLLPLQKIELRFFAPPGPAHTAAAAEARTCLTTNYYVYSRLREGQVEAEVF